MSGKRAIPFPTGKQKFKLPKVVKQNIAMPFDLNACKECTCITHFF